MPPFFYVLPGYFFCLIAGIIYFKHLPKPYRLVFGLFLIGIFCQAYGYYLAHYLHKWNWWVFNIYMLLEVWFMGGAAMYIVKDRRIKLVFLSLLVVNTVIWLFEIAVKTIYLPPNIALVSYSISLTAIYIVVLVNGSLFSQKNMLKLPVFWLAVSAILYFSCMVPYLGLSSFLFRKFPGLAYKLHLINIVLNIIRYPFVAASFILVGREKHIHSPSLSPELAK